MGSAMRFVGTVILALILVIFSASNTAWIEVGFWPFRTALNVQIFWVLFAGIFIGVLLSALVTGVDRVKRSYSLRKNKKEVTKLKKRVHDLEQDALPAPEDRILAIEQAQTGR